MGRCRRQRGGHRRSNPHRRVSDASTRGSAATGHRVTGRVVTRSCLHVRAGRALLHGHTYVRRSGGQASAARRHPSRTVRPRFGRGPMTWYRRLAQCVRRGDSTRPNRPELCSERQRPHSPIGRGSGLKIRPVSVRVRLGARELGTQRCWYRRSSGSLYCGPRVFCPHSAHSLI